MLEYRIHFEQQRLGFVPQALLEKHESAADALNSVVCTVFKADISLRMAEPFVTDLLVGSDSVNTLGSATMPLSVVVFVSTTRQVLLIWYEA